mgnify:CR=1 FL=1
MLVIIILVGMFTKSKNKAVPIRYWLLLLTVPVTTLGTLTVYQYYIEAPSVTLLNTLDKQLPTSAKNILVDKSPVMQLEDQTPQRDIHWLQLVGGVIAIFLLLFIWRKYR